VLPGLPRQLNTKMPLFGRNRLIKFLQNFATFHYSAALLGFVFPSEFEQNYGVRYPPRSIWQHWTWAVNTPNCAGNFFSRIFSCHIIALIYVGNNRLQNGIMVLCSGLLHTSISYRMFLSAILCRKIIHAVFSPYFFQ
jgi:hypothetical protein